MPKRHYNILVQNEKGKKQEEERMKNKMKVTTMLFIMLIGSLLFGKEAFAQVVEINEVNFPDQAVREALYEWETEECDGWIEADDITYLFISNARDLKGLELFENLEELNLEVYNKDNLSLNNKKLSQISLGIKGNKISVNLPYVEDVTIQSSVYTVISLNTPNIQRLSISGTSQLVSFPKISGGDFSNLQKLLIQNMRGAILDVSQFENLALLQLYETQIGKVNGMKKLKKLESLYIYNENSLKSIDISSNTNLKDIDIRTAKIQTLNTGNCTKLTSLYCYGTKIKSLKLDKSAKLQSLSVISTPITKLDLSKNKNLTSVGCYRTKLATLSLAKNSKLKDLTVSDTNIKVIDLKNNTQIQYLNVSDTKVSTMDVSKYKNLYMLNLSGTKVKSINVKKNKKLTNLDISNTSIKTLDVNNNTKLNSLYCNNTKLKSLNLKKNKALKRLFVYNTGIKKLNLTKQNNLSLYLKCKAGKSINLKNYIGAGYKAEDKSSNLKYNKKKGTVKVVKKKGKTNNLSWITLVKGKKTYDVYIYIK